MKHPHTGLNLREQDGYDAFNRVIDEMIENKVDIVLCSGDIFHSPTPSIRTIVECQNGLKKLSDAHIPFYNIAGNHDATDSIRDIPSNGTLHFPMLNWYSYTEPYVIKEIFPNVLFHFVSHHGFVEQEETMKKIKLSEDKMNILVTHGSVFDSVFGGVLHSEAEPREIVIPEYIMNMGWDYTLMGHIHTRGWVHSKDGKTDTENRKQFYGGSLLRRGFSDKKGKLGRGWTLWTIDTDKKTMLPTLHTIPERQQEDVIVYCKNKEATIILEEVLNQFKNIDFAQHPIVRLNLVDLSAQTKLLLDWSSIQEQINNCLSFTYKAVTVEEFKREVEKQNFSFDLLTAYNEFWDIVNPAYEEQYRQNVFDTSMKLLRSGQSKILQ